MSSATITSPGTRIAEHVFKIGNSALRSAFQHYQRYEMSGAPSDIRKSMQTDWKHIGSLLQGKLDFNDPMAALVSLQETGELLINFENQYSQYFNDDEAKFIADLRRDSNIARKMHFGIHLINWRSSDWLESLKQSADGISMIRSLLEDFLTLPNSIGRSEIIYDFMEFATQTLKTDPSKIQFKAKDDTETILFKQYIECVDSEVRSLLTKIHEIAEKEGFIKSEVEGKVVYLSPDSAEGRAIQRIREPEQDFVIMIDDDEEFLPETEELRRSGRIVKTVSQVRAEVEALSKR